MIVHRQCFSGPLGRQGRAGVSVAVSVFAACVEYALRGAGKWGRWWRRGGIDQEVEQAVRAVMLTLVL